MRCFRLAAAALACACALGDGLTVSGTDEEASDLTILDAYGRRGPEPDSLLDTCGLEPTSELGCRFLCRTIKNVSLAVFMRREACRHDAAVYEKCFDDCNTAKRKRMELFLLQTCEKRSCPRTLGHPGWPQKVDDDERGCCLDNCFWKKSLGVAGEKCQCQVYESCRLTILEACGPEPPDEQACETFIVTGEDIDVREACRETSWAYVACFDTWAKVAMEKTCGQDCPKY